eukprot:gene5543-3998_t
MDYYCPVPVQADRYKTRLCDKFMATGFCPYEVRCMFAHGESELRTAEDNIRDGLVTEEAIRAFRAKMRRRRRRAVARHRRQERLCESELQSVASAEVSAAEYRHHPYVNVLDEPVYLESAVAYFPAVSLCGSDTEDATVRSPELLEAAVDSRLPLIIFYASLATASMKLFWCGMTIVSEGELLQEAFTVRFAALFLTLLHALKNNIERCYALLCLIDTDSNCFVFPQLHFFLYIYIYIYIKAITHKKKSEKMMNKMLPAQVHVPATPAIQAVDIRAFYDVDNPQMLGKGGFSEVVTARHIPTGETRALKIIRKEILTGKKAEMVTHEKEILRRTNHPCIITLYETIQTANHVFLALDLMSEDLFEFVVRNRTVNEALTRKIMHQAAAHPPANINDVDPKLVEVVVKIADFGLSKLVLEYDVRNTPCGTSYYLAPEIIRGIEEQGARPLCTNHHLVKSIDVWSCGVVFYVLLCGRPPFSGRAIKTSQERQEMLMRMDRGVLFHPSHGWNNVSNEAKDLICLMLEQDTAKRITAEAALAHPFFTANGFPRPIPAPMPALREHVRPAGIGAAGPGAAEAAREKDRGVFQTIKSIFTRTAEQQKMQEELAELQKGQVEEDDKEGEETTYTSSMQMKAAKPSKPAVMNTKFKVGPGALKK